MFSNLTCGYASGNVPVFLFRWDSFSEEVSAGGKGRFLSLLR